MKKVTEQHFCDRCGKEIEVKKEGMFIENLCYNASYYQRAGDGGSSKHSFEFCKNCSETFERFMANIQIFYGK